MYRNNYSAAEQVTFMQCYVKSAGRSYDQDYTWVQISGEACDCTESLRGMSRYLSVKTPSLALFRQGSLFCLLLGGLKTGRTDIVGTPIVDTFAFVCPAEEEENIRCLAAGFITNNSVSAQLFCSATCEEAQAASGFCVSEKFVSSLKDRLLNEGRNSLALLKKERDSFPREAVDLLCSPLSPHQQKILLINSDCVNCQDFSVFFSQNIDFR